MPRGSAYSETRKVMAELERLASLAVATLVVTVVENLTDDPPLPFATPIDTGWASSNWLVGVGSPPQGPVGSKLSVSRSDQFEGLSAMRFYDIRSALPVYVVNEVPYIEELNQTGGREVGPGFIQKALDKAVNIDVPNELRKAGLG